MDKVMFSSASVEWGTPKAFFDELDKEFHFNLDPCATEQNHKCDKYFTKEDDGLTQNWGGSRVFCNPPYGRSLTEKWVKKCYEESLKPNTLVVMLIPARTDTRWFHDYIYHKAELRFIRGRLRFELNGITQDSATFPSMIVIFGGKTNGKEENP